MSTVQELRRLHRGESIRCMPEVDINQILVSLGLTNAQAVVYKTLQGLKKAEREKVKNKFNPRDVDVVSKKILENDLRQYYPDNYSAKIIKKLRGLSFFEFWEDIYEQYYFHEKALELMDYLERKVTPEHALAYCEFAYGGRNTVAPERMRQFEELKVDIENGRLPHPKCIDLTKNTLRHDENVELQFSVLIARVDLKLSVDEIDYYEGLLLHDYVLVHDEYQNVVDSVKEKIKNHTLGHIGQITPHPNGKRYPFLHVWEMRLQENVERYLCHKLPLQYLDTYLKIGEDGEIQSDEILLRLLTAIDSNLLMHPKYLRVTRERFPNLRRQIIRRRVLDAVHAHSRSFAVAVQRQRSRHERKKNLSEKKALALLTDINPKQCAICLDKGANCRIIHKIKNDEDKTNHCDNRLCFKCLKKCIRKQSPTNGIIQPQCPFCRQKINACVKYTPGNTEEEPHLIHLPVFDCNNIPPVYRKKFKIPSKKTKKAVIELE